MGEYRKGEFNMTTSLPNTIFSGYWRGGHCQGIAVDTERKYIYYSFTTELVKTDLAGNLIGSVKGLLGHLGCIAFNDADGKLYGSLEYKNDAIGKGVLKNLGKDIEMQEAFYIAVFDVEKIDRVVMDAAEGGVMKAVYLKEVVDDYCAEVERNGRILKHRYGCSGIDGTTFAPIPGSGDSKKYLMVAYGIYSDPSRRDNDHQVILCYDVEGWDAYAQTLIQTDMHHNGPETYLRKFFVHTGNTTYGVQNLEYDSYTNTILAAVYRGNKLEYPNYPFFAIDASVAPEMQQLRRMEEEGEVLQLAKKGEYDGVTDTYGWYWRLGMVGMYSFGDGLYYFAQDGRNENGWYVTVKLCRWNGENPFEFVD